MFIEVCFPVTEMHPDVSWSSMMVHSDPDWFPHVNFDLLLSGPINTKNGHHQEPEISSFWLVGSKFMWDYRLSLCQS